MPSGGPAWATGVFHPFAATQLIYADMSAISTTLSMRMGRCPRAECAA